MFEIYRLLDCKYNHKKTLLTFMFSYQSDIAFDDLKLVPGACEPASPKMDPLPIPYTITQKTTKKWIKPKTTPSSISTTEDTMTKREYMPFYVNTFSSCSVKSEEGKLLFEDYLTGLHVCCGHQ